MEPMETMQMMDAQRKLYTVVEVAAILGLGRTLVYQLVLRGDIPSIKIGRSRRIPRFAVDDFIRQRLALDEGLRIRPSTARDGAHVLH